MSTRLIVVGGGAKGLVASGSSRPRDVPSPGAALVIASSVGIAGTAWRAVARLVA